ncbi:MAG: hypothetical protein IJM46_02565 [Oscillospiraceae bacterium]|nr:hypothetical protein [Oscillospiraceae bacterium]
MKCTIYPYADALYPLLENQQDLIGGIRIRSVVYPRAWRRLMYHTHALETVASGWDFETLTADSDCVIFADVSEKEYMYPDILEKAAYSLAAGRDVIFCTRLLEQDEAELRRRFPERTITVKYTAGRYPVTDLYRHEDISCAALGIGCLYRGLDDVVAVTGITAACRRRNLRTVTVAGNATLTLLGFYQFPSGIFRSGLDIEQQAGALNAFFAALEQRTHCDLFIVQFPDGMMKFMNETEDAYGIKAFMLTRAVPFDYFVLGTFLEITHPDAYAHVRSIIGKRFGLPLDACLFQHLKADRAFSAEYRRILYTRNRIETRYSDYEALRQNMQNLIIADYDDRNACEAIADDLIRKLS